MKSYTCYYQMGGTEKFKWVKCLPVTDEKVAQQQVKDTRQMGYVAHYQETESLEINGLPETWDDPNKYGIRW